MSKKCSNPVSCLSNPVPANQVVDVKLEWECLTAPTCTTLEATLQELLNAICAGAGEPDLEYHCLTPVSSSIADVLQAIINKICDINDCPTCPDSTGGTATSVDLSSVNLCLPDTFSTTDSLCCITAEACDPEPSNEEIIQSTVSRVITLSEIVKQQAALIEDLTSRLDTLEGQVNSCDCCRVSDVETQVTVLTGQIVDINTQLTNINTNCC